MMNELTDEQIEKIIETLKQNIEVEAIVVFGSAAKGKLRDDSDVDIAFISKQKYDSYKIFMIAQELAIKLRRDVDLVDFRKIDSTLQSEIVGGGKIILGKESAYRQELYIRAMKEYCLLNEERAEILKKFEGDKNG